MDSLNRGAAERSGTGERFRTRCLLIAYLKYAHHDHKVSVFL
jgi:hypothetical protein